MIKRLVSISILVLSLMCLCSCSAARKNSSFSITFLDVGQGDAALVECDGLYMLIDGGSEKAGSTVYNYLVEHEIDHLEMLVVSHLHEDHYGGLIKALTYAQNVRRTICNKLSSDTDKASFAKFEHTLANIGTSIEVPTIGDTFKLGSATVEVLDMGTDEANDSLVLLVTYKKTRFLFTGDIQANGQLRVARALEERHGNFKGVSLIKMPHHGAYNDPLGFNDSALNSLLWLFDPSYCVISVGTGNKYGHPHQDTLEIIDNLIVRSKELDPAEHVFRTDLHGNIIVSSNGKQISVKKSK